MKPLHPRGISAAGLATGRYLLDVVDGKVTGLAAESAVGSTTDLLPLTTSVNGVPELVWESDDSLIFTEVPR